MNSLKLRKLQESDLETLRRWRMSPQITKYLLSDPVLTSQDQRQWYKELQEKGNSIYWILSFEGLDIGYATLLNIDKKNKKADCGVYIADIAYRGRGFGKFAMSTLQKYAFEQLHLHKLYGRVLSGNHAALIMDLKSGLKIEGVLRDHIFKDKFYDVYMVGLLKEDWLKWI